jgi:GTP diphosphokinase / guanosine-3',5'-bis(diphosphate) 3'-diphosphatase
MDNISEIMEKIRGYAADADLKTVMQAYLLAARAHAGQTRKSGEPYLSHPLAVAMILADMRMDVDTVATALLHDALEDNPITKQEMAREIGDTIAGLVDGVTKIGKLKFRSKEELQAENFRKMMLAMSRDLRVILVKLADRLHNMRTLEHHREEKQRMIANETLEIFVPIANRLGLVKFKAELEDLCFRYLFPEEFKLITEYLHETQADREAYIDRCVDTLNKHLSAKGVECTVWGRAKHRYSIYWKMKKQGLKVSEVQDLLAFRVIVPDLSQCYGALGLVHSEFPPIPDRIKDYIARPKANGYQSLHTTVIGPDARRIEIQIRTLDMHRIAEEGIAAHWTYKEGHLAVSPDDVLRIAKIRDLFDSVRDMDSATEFMETVKVEFYADEVFVFTPAGDIKRFPSGATSLDFAYAVHTDVGHRCTGAKVNGRLVPLRYHLQSGDTVEILTSQTQKPNRDWLTYAKTGRAISKIRKFLRDEEIETGIRLGQEMLESELKRFGWNINKTRSEGRLKEFIRARSYADTNRLYVDVARGALALSHAVSEILPEGMYTTRHEATQPSGFASLFNRFRTRTESPVLITGEDGVLVTYAGCCEPLPGEPVVGFITRGRGITVHRNDCQQLASMDVERRIPVEWDPGSEQKHSGQIQVLCRDRPGMLANITRVCEQSKVNINRVEAKPMDTTRSVCTLEVAVRNVDELSRLIKNIEKLRGVENVERAVG